jgi:hypothetical protein
MQINIVIPTTVWSILCNRVMSHVNDAQFVQAGVWQLCHVQLNVPLAMASELRDEHLPLIAWLESQQIEKRICAAKRSDIALLLTFGRFR